MSEDVVIRTNGLTRRFGAITAVDENVPIGDLDAVVHVVGIADNDDSHNAI